ncbi:MAG: hypothetical protein IPM29_15465 [Planctomycetes bacterium]|nr:hypothetical protein [Planctomycetota bacterium]
MNATLRIHRSSVALATLVVLAPVARLPAQREATTLAALVDRSTHIAVVQLTALQERGDELGAVMQRIDALLGTPPQTSTRAEPAARACGCALHGLAVGDRLLAFLNEAGRPTALGARGLPRATPELVAHVRSLLATRGDPVARCRALGLALAAADSRVAGDAALGLGLAPGLERADEPTRARLRAALARALEGATTEVPALLVGAERLGDEACVDLVAAAYLGTRDQAVAAATRATLLRLPAPLVAPRLATPAVIAGPARERVLALAELAPADLGRPLAAALLRATHPSDRPGLERSAVAWLRAGGDTATVAWRTDAATAARCARLAADPTGPALRCIDPSDLR